MQLGEEIIYRCNQQTQVVVLDPRKGDGLRVKEFYAISELPCVMIVMDGRHYNSSMDNIATQGRGSDLYAQPYKTAICANV